MYTGRGPVCGMIIRGGGATGAAGRAGAALCICATFVAVDAAGGAPMLGAAGVVLRGGIATAGEVVLAVAGGVATAGVGGILGGITTTAGGRYCAATEAGVTILGAGAEVSTGFGGGTAFATAGASGASTFASTAEGAAGGLTTTRGGAGCSTAPFCCVMARNTSPGREIFDRSILVLIPSSTCAGREVFVELDAASERPRRCFRTSSASCSSRELECVFFSVTPTVVSTSRISLLLTSNSRARSLIRILLIRSYFLFLCCKYCVSKLAYLTSRSYVPSYCG